LAIKGGVSLSLPFAQGRKRRQGGIVTGRPAEGVTLLFKFKGDSQQFVKPKRGGRGEKGTLKFREKTRGKRGGGLLSKREGGIIYFKIYQTKKKMKGKEGRKKEIEINLIN